MPRSRLGVHRKPRRNPEGICKCCKEKIKNKQRGSLYCKDCMIDLAPLRELIHIAVYRAKIKNPNLLGYTIQLIIKAKSR